LPVLVHRCPTLFSHHSRAMYVRASAFGTSRALHWTQMDAVAELRAAYTVEKDMLEAAVAAALPSHLGLPSGAMAALAAIGGGGRGERVSRVIFDVQEEMDKWRHGGGLSSIIARVHRSELLPMAEKLMARQAESKTRRSLEVQFEGESGFGSGVTQNFYSSVADELLKAAGHAALPLWIVEGSSGTDDEYVRHSGALFPLPLPATAPPARVTAVCARFRFLGRLMAAACRDGFIVPLPLSMHFLHLVRGGSLSYAALPPPTETGGRLSAYAAVVGRLAQYDAACAAGQISEMERQRRYDLEAEAEFGQSKLGMSMPLSLRGALDLEAFVCPLTQTPLSYTGRDEDAGALHTPREVTIHTLSDYVSKVAQLWLQDGVARQAAAFRAGIEDLCSSPEILLAPFTLPELQTMLCGTSTIAPWSEAELRAALQPAAPYTRESPTYALLVSELMRMDEAGRAKFLTFVSACPHLPPVGLKALAISVHRLESIGLRWSRCPDDTPPAGRELHSAALAMALRHQSTFTLEELRRHGVRDLHADDFVKVKFTSPADLTAAATDAPDAGGCPGDARGGAAVTTVGYYRPCDTPTPTSHTCTATLSLPEYTSAEALHAGLQEAFANMEKGGLHEQTHR